MASSTTKKVIPLALLLIVITFIGFVLILRSWQGEDPAEVEDLMPPMAQDSEKSASDEPEDLRERLSVKTDEYKRDIQATIREMNLEGGKVSPIGVAEREVLERYFAQAGGIDAISSVISVRASGEIVDTLGNKLDIIITKKRGDSMRTTLTDGSSRIVTVLSPDDNWQAVWKEGQLAKVSNLSPSQIEAGQRAIYVVNELYLAQRRGWEMNYLGVQPFDYKLAHVFEVTPSPGHTIQYFIDPDEFVDIGRVDKVRRPDGSITVAKSLISDHFISNGLVFPGTTEMFENEQLVQTLHMESVQFNVGVLDSIFQRPGLTVTP